MERRRGGVLLHPTSLPGDGPNGVLGPHAFRFVDMLADCGFTVWQTLPLGPVHDDLSPYACQSVHAGNADLISLQRLHEAGWLGEDLTARPGEDPRACRRRLLRAAYEAFARDDTPHHVAAFQAFVAEHQAWLEDYALFRTIRELQDQRPWWQWPAKLRDRAPAVLDAIKTRHAAALGLQRFLQYVFYQQWRELRAYGAERDVLMFGDLPLFVAEDSADVWAHRECFRLNGDGRPEVVAGVPPDYFSATGQRWGNPHYDWDHMRSTGFDWWVRRMASQLELFDIVRVDHFRGLQASWEIPADEDTAINGRWVEAPGGELLDTFQRTFHRLPLVAEDLGTITDEVDALRARFDLPGMRILQFAFGGGADNPYLPHNYVPATVAYTGTHDNDTSLGWFEALGDGERRHVLDYLGCTAEAMPGALARAALASVAHLAIVPMQDILGLGGDSRMNSPGLSHGTNWRWRFSWEQLEDGMLEHYRQLLGLYGRV
ncbi:MAG: 4-alpha-glucanotransferase [Gammaproteobacteria bacterium]|nr:4-alpha-glucanotransferase [Gammaproteobacteria bacterium]